MMRNVAVLSKAVTSQSLTSRLPAQLAQEIRILDGNHLIDENEKCSDRSRMKSILDSSEIIIADPSCLVDIANLVKESPVKWIQMTWAGLDGFIHRLPDAAAYLQGKQITRLGGIFGQAMAEYTLAQIVNWDRQFYSCYLDQKERYWNKAKYHSYRKLTDMTVTIVGMGDIGLDIGRSCRQFGMNVLGIGRREKKEIENFDERHGPTCNAYGTISKDLLEFCSRSDVIVNVLPATADTDGILDNDELWAACLAAGRKPFFINIGRGNVISEKRILDCLENGSLSSATLDVFATEPLPTDSPLWTHPRCVITPHVAALTFPKDVVDCFRENFLRYKCGAEMKYLFQFERGY